MLICPKLGVDNISIDENLVPYLNGTFEIQMSGDNLHNSFLKSVRIIEAVKKFITVNEVILHLPFKFHTFELLKMFPGKLAELYQMLDMSSEFAGKQNIKLGILFHSELGFDYIQNDEMISFIYQILSRVEKTNVYLLIENVLPDLTSPFSSRISSFELLLKVKHEKLLGCFDICHFRASENVLKQELEVPAELFDRIHEVHFSAALNGDGYIDKKNTHGVCHNNYSDFERDFKLVSSLDTDGTLVVVAELSETDYSIRDNMKAEMNLLRYRVMQGVPLHD